MHHGLRLKSVAWAYIDHPRRMVCMETTGNRRGAGGGPAGGEVAGQPALGWQFRTQLGLDKAKRRSHRRVKPARRHRATTLPLETPSLHHLLYHRLRRESSEKALSGRKGALLHEVEPPFWARAAERMIRGQCLSRIVSSKSTARMVFSDVDSDCFRLGLQLSRGRYCIDGGG